MISAPGIGSGLDVTAIVNAMMGVERVPLLRLEDRKQNFEDQISGYGTLRSALDDFKTAMDDLSSLDKFEIYKANSSDEGVATATADSDAVAGSYQLTVDRLAQAHKMGSAGMVAPTTTFGGADPLDALNITAGSSTFSINTYNGGAGMTLAEISDAINADADNDSVSAAIITGNNGEQQLSLTSKNSGYDERIQASYAGAGDTSALNLTTLNIDPDVAGALLTDLSKLDALFSVDGVAGITRASNSINDVISGVTLELSSVGSSRIDIANDKDEVKKSIEGFVSGYNDLLTKIDQLGAVDTGKLAGDSSLRRIVAEFRSEINTAVAGGNLTMLSEVGITTNKDTGKLELDAADFDAAVANDFSDVAHLFGNATDGIAMRLADSADLMLQSSTGLIDIRSNGLQESVRRLDNNILRLEALLETRELNYFKQYSTLDGLVSKMNSTSDFLTAQLGAMSNNS